MEPDWSKAPSWAKYTAMDANGIWYWYECIPQWVKEDSCWEGYGKQVKCSPPGEMIAKDSLRWKP